MATPTGIEPVISGVTGRRDSHLRYGAIFIYKAQKYHLKINGKIYSIYCCLRLLAGAEGFEPSE